MNKTLLIAGMIFISNVLFGQTLKTLPQVQAPVDLSTCRDSSNIAGQQVKVRGVVIMAPNLTWNNAFGRHFFIQTGNGAYRGLEIRQSSSTLSTGVGSVQVGDSIEITGTIQEFSGHTQFNPDVVQTMNVPLGTGSVRPALFNDLSEFNDANRRNKFLTGEQWESQFVEITGPLTVTFVDLFAGGTRCSFDVVDASGNKMNVTDLFECQRLATNGGAYVPPVVGDVYSKLSGMIVHSRNDDPTLGCGSPTTGRGYQLAPFSTTHYVLCTNPATPGAISGSASICSGVSTTYSVAAVSGATSYTWTLPAGWSGTSSTNSITVTTGSNSGDITVTANNACGSSTAQTKTVTINSIPAMPGTISGNNTVCASSSNTYSVNAVAGATSYTWTLPGGWSGTSTTNSINTTSGSSGGNITVRANNSCGNSAVQTLTISIVSGIGTPGAISGTTTVCEGTTNTYSIATVSGASSYTWTLPGGWTGSSTTNSITATSGASSGNITVVANSSCGNSSPQTLGVTVTPLPTTPGTISGTTSICQNSTNSYSVSAVSGATSYTWTLPGGWSGTSTSNSINATAGTSGGNIMVTANNSCGSSASQSLSITVNNAPAMPSTISGSTDICSGSSNSYSVAAVGGATSYTWTLPGGWSGTSTTNAITTTAGTTGGNITVSANNNCGSSAAQTATITVNTAPATPGTISGNTSVCTGSSNAYTISPVAGATSYTWTLPAGWGGTASGTSINTSASNISGNITVTASNSCGTSAVQTLAVTIVTSIGTPGAINGNTSVCAGTSVTYSIASVSGASSYTWTLPNGWNGTSTSNSITATAGNSGTISVVANSSCGNSSAQTLAITVNTATQPAISQNVNTLTCTVTATSYQWYLDGNIINGATSQTYTVTSNGNYSVKIVDNNGCESTSAALTVVAGVERIGQKLAAVKLYPNPATNTINIESAESGNFVLTDVVGNSILQTTVQNATLDISGIARGMYQYSYTTEKGTITGKLVIE